MAKAWAVAFYHSKEWIQGRDAYIRSVFGLCERCRNGTPGYIVHHKIPLTPQNIHNQNITLNPDNLIYLCKNCHEAVHHPAADPVRDDVMFDADGNIVAKR
jgi:5-methylcytosine-specific restriction enzyme A